MIIKIITIIMIISGVALLLLPLRPPSWRFSVLDRIHPKRFVALALSGRSPTIVYFNEKDEGGVLYQKARSTGFKLFDDLKYYFGERAWNSGTIDSAKYAGMFPSAVSDQKGRIHVAYQDATPGREKLMYAVFDGKSWKKEVVDDVVSNGVDVGTYTSISILSSSPSTDHRPPTTDNDSIPVIFYHTSQGQKFGYAIRSQKDTSEVTRRVYPERGSSDGGGTKSDAWEKKTLEKKVGWLTASASCGDKVFAAYRGRDTQEIHLGELKSDLGWSSRPLPASTSAGLAIVAVNAKDTPGVARPARRSLGEGGRDSPGGGGTKNEANQGCFPYLAYYDDKTGQVKFVDPSTGRSAVVSSGALSRISLAANNVGFKIAYHVDEKGLVFGESPDGINWKSQFLVKGRRDGIYNALAIDKDDNVYLAYLDEANLKYAEHNTSSVKTVKNVKTGLAAALLTVGATTLATSFMRKPKFKQPRIKLQTKTKK